MGGRVALRIGMDVEERDKSLLLPEIEIGSFVLMPSLADTATLAHCLEQIILYVYIWCIDYCITDVSIRYFNIA